MYRDVVNGQLRCRDCKNWFDIERFQHHKQKDGKRRPGSYCPDCKKAHGRLDRPRLRYGLSAEQLADLIEKYPVCAICGSQQTFIDHNHLTGKVRGRLCRSCNTAIGLFQEREDLLDSAKIYLTSFRTSGTVKL